MAKKALDILKQFFIAGKKPTQEQFHDTLDSFVHKDEGIDSITSTWGDENVGNRLEVNTPYGDYPNMRQIYFQTHGDDSDTTDNEGSYISQNMGATIAINPEEGFYVNAYTENNYSALGIWPGGIHSSTSGDIYLNAANTYSENKISYINQYTQEQLLDEHLVNKAVVAEMIGNGGVGAALSAQQVSDNGHFRITRSNEKHPGDYIFSFECIGPTQQSSLLQVSPDQAMYTTTGLLYLASNNTANLGSNLQLDKGKIVVQATGAGAMEYFDNYRSQYTDRSIVDKAYVDSKQTYKRLIGLISQIDTNDPTITILENSLDFIVNFVRTSEGFYEATLPNPVNVNKIWTSITNAWHSQDVQYGFGLLQSSGDTGDRLGLSTYQYNIGATDGKFTRVPFEIRIFE